MCGDSHTGLENGMDFRPLTCENVQWNERIDMQEIVDTVVIGAGVIGLAVARELAQRGREVWLLEQAGAIGQGISARSSEVVHAGIYYPIGSWKARLCVEGRELLYGYCAARGVPFRRLGKLVIATEDAQLPLLESMAMRARASGVDDLVLLDADGVARLEPSLRCRGALSSPSTGIIDSHALMWSLLADAEAAGAVLVLHSPVRRIDCDGGVLRLEIGEEGSDNVSLLATRQLVNAAGLDAAGLAAMIEGLPDVPRARYAKGNYFSVAGRVPFERLIYPLPEPGGLGVHLTLDLGGQARFGPDVEWVEQPDYQVDPGRAGAFAEAIRRWWPALPETALMPAYAGVRPKLDGRSGDFCIEGPEVHGLDGLVNLFGIESPGLTACLAIAREVGDRLDGHRPVALDID